MSVTAKRASLYVPLIRIITTYITHKMWVANIGQFAVWEPSA